MNHQLAYSVDEIQDKVVKSIISKVLIVLNGRRELASSDEIKTELDIVEQRILREFVLEEI